MNKKISLPFAIALAAGPAFGEAQIDLTYSCANGEIVRAIYVNDTEPQLVVLNVNGGTSVLRSAISASGARYTEKPDGEIGMVWWEGGEGVTLERPSPEDAKTMVAVMCHVKTAP